MDLITDLPASRGYNSILTIVDHGCSKAAIFLPCHKAIDAIGVASLYAERVFPFYGIPKKIISDRDPQFMAQFAKELCGVLKIDQNLSTAYHPQTDGQSERANQRVEQYLRIYGNEEQNDWADLLPLAQFTHNTWPNESTGQTPFNLLIGHMPTLVIAEKDTTIFEITRRKEWLEQNRLRAQAALKNAQRMLVQRTN
jgi:transposase InsO family protein